MTLDDRARHAAAAIRESVGSAELMLFEAGVPGARKSDRPTVRVRALAFGGAFAVVVLVVGLSLLPGRLFAPDDSDVAGQGAQGIGQEAVVPPEDSVPSNTVPADSVGTQVPRGSVDGQFDQALKLTILSPVDGEEVFDESVTFSGTVAPGSKVYARTADVVEAEVDVEGNWFIRLLVQAPATTARFFAEDSAGNQSSDASVTVIYTPPSPDATIVPDPPEDDPSEGNASDDDQSTSEGSPPTVAFTASEEFGSGSGEAAFDVYSGAATPDDRIRVASEYGQGGVRADDEGQWSVRVTFGQAPPNEPFTVTVTNLGTGETFEFEFTLTS